jgi:hypothetical protein
VLLLVLAMANVASADIFGTGVNQFAIDFVDISSNTNPTSGYGIVNNDYRMGTYEITNDQFAKFTANSPQFTGTDVPANRVTWYESGLFVIRTLNALVVRYSRGHLILILVF